MRVNLKVARLLLNFSAVGTAFIYWLRGTPVGLLLPATLFSLVFVNVVFSWAQRSRPSKTPPDLTGSPSTGQDRAAGDLKGVSLKAWLLFLTSLGSGALLGICYTHDTKQWLFIPAGTAGGCLLGLRLMRKYR